MASKPQKMPKVAKVRYIRVVYRLIYYFRSIGLLKGMFRRESHCRVCFIVYNQNKLCPKAHRSHECLGPLSTKPMSKNPQMQ